MSSIRSHPNQSTVIFDEEPFHTTHKTQIHEKNNYTQRNGYFRKVIKSEF